jgi:quinol monooxygenase YgiN
MEDIERHLETSHALAFDEATAGLLAEEENITYLEKIV